MVMPFTGTHTPTSVQDTKNGKEEEVEEGTWWTSILMQTSALCSLAMSEEKLRCGQTALCLPSRHASSNCPQLTKNFRLMP